MTFSIIKPNQSIMYSSFIFVFIFKLFLTSYFLDFRYKEPTYRGSSLIALPYATEV